MLVCDTGLNQWRTATWLRANPVAAGRIQFPMVPGGYFQLRIVQASGQAGKSGQLAAFIQQRIRHIYRRQRTAPIPSRTAKSGAVGAADGAIARSDPTR
jgi:hypothetical protein